MLKKWLAITLLITVSQASLFSITNGTAAGKTLRNSVIAGSIGGALGYLFSNGCSWDLNSTSKRSMFTYALIFGIPTCLISAAMYYLQTPSINFSVAEEKIKSWETRAVVNIVLRNMNDKAAMTKSLIEHCSTYPYPLIQALVSLEECVCDLHKSNDWLIEAKNDRHDEEFVDKCDKLIERAESLHKQINESILYIKSLSDYPEQRHIYEQMKSDIRKEQAIHDAMQFQTHYVINI